MHIGLFFGSFNPVHAGHMVLANYMLEFTEMEQVWFVVSPHNPHKEKATLLDQNTRLLLVTLAVEDHPKMRASNIEFSLPQPSYTIHTLVHLKEKYPAHEFSLIMGEDNLASLHKWKNYEQIIESHRVYVYPRPGVQHTSLMNRSNIIMTKAPVIEISATFIRQAIADKKDIRFFLPPKVWDEIERSNLYKNKNR